VLCVLVHAGDLIEVVGRVQKVAFAREASDRRRVNSGSQASVEETR
jgi:hypothetical protein